MYICLPTWKCPLLKTAGLQLFIKLHFCSLNYLKYVYFAFLQWECTVPFMLPKGMNIQAVLKLRARLPCQVLKEYPKTCWAIIVMRLLRFCFKSVAVCIAAYVSYKSQVVEDYFTRELCGELFWVAWQGSNLRDFCQNNFWFSSRWNLKMVHSWWWKGMMYILLKRSFLREWSQGW